MKLFIDDIRDPPTNDYHVVRSTTEAIEWIKTNGMPSFISFDHDLGGDDTSMIFLNKIYQEFWKEWDDIPDYQVHSANPIGSKNIVSFMESWKKAYGK
jgi:hypothetical protein